MQGTIIIMTCVHVVGVRVDGVGGLKVRFRSVCYIVVETQSRQYDLSIVSS